MGIYFTFFYFGFLWFTREGGGCKGQALDWMIDAGLEGDDGLSWAFGSGCIGRDAGLDGNRIYSSNIRSRESFSTHDEEESLSLVLVCPVANPLVLWHFPSHLHSRSRSVHVGLKSRQQ